MFLGATHGQFQYLSVQALNFKVLIRCTTSPTDSIKTKLLCLGPLPVSAYSLYRAEACC